MNTTSNKARVPFISKIAYGMGDVGCNFSWMFVSNFLMIFYTDVFGIGMSAVATLMLVSRIWDAVNDPIIGTLTDKTHTRWGRFRPWLLFGAPITAIILMLTFWAHPHWSQTAKIVYMAVTYCILVLGYTCVNLPYGTLCGAMTQNIDERAKLNTSRYNIWYYLRSLPPVLLQQDQGGGGGAGRTEASHIRAAQVGAQEPSLPACHPRTVSLRIHPLRPQCRHPLLFHVRRGFGYALQLLLHGHHPAVNSRSRLLPLDVPQDRQ